MRTLIRDLRFAFRTLAGVPGFAAVVVVTLALGLAPAATVFSWIDSLVLHPFPGTSDPDGLAVLEMSIPSAPNGGTSASWLDYKDYRDHLTLISGLAPQRYGSFSLGEPEQARLAWGELVSVNYFQLLGVRPVLGQLFVPGAPPDTPGAYPAVVISERLWRGQFGGNPSIAGSVIRVNGVALTVAGVAPARFRGTSPAMSLDLWIPAPMGPALAVMGETALTNRGDRSFSSMLVRRKPGVTMPQLQAEVSALAASLAERYPATNRGVSAVALPPWRAHSGTGDLLLPPLLILMAASMVLLSIACANAANLLLARSLGRSAEFGVRVALGASRWRVMRQLLTEAVVLAAFGTAAGLMVLPWMWNTLLAMVPDVGLPIARELEWNGRITVFLALCGVISVAAAGLAPALLSVKTNLSGVLNQGGRAGIGGGATHRARNSLIAAEVALAAVALVSAGLFTRSFRNASTIDTGFDSSHVLFGRFFLEGARYTPQQQAAFAERLRLNLSNAGGVQAASYADFTPLSTSAGPYSRIEPEGYASAPGESMNVNRATVSPGYFASLRIPILEGREFRDSDLPDSPPVIIVNQTFARKYFGSENVTGRRVRTFNRWVTIVGVARDGKYFNPAEAPQPHFYMPIRQFPRGLRELYFFVRTPGAPELAIPLLRQAAHDADAGTFSLHAVALAEYTQVALLPLRVASNLLLSLGLICLFLVALGLYSVMSYTVSQRRREIGVRIALGARPSDVTAMLLRQGLLLTACGLAAGLAAAWAVTRMAAGMLVNVRELDPLSFLAAVLFLIAAAGVATWLPARRAARIDPVTAVRNQMS